MDGERETYLEEPGYKWCVQREETRRKGMGDGNKGHEAKQAINYGLIDVHSRFAREDESCTEQTSGPWQTLEGNGVKAKMRDTYLEEPGYKWCA
jgi:hypothetical protein